MTGNEYKEAAMRTYDGKSNLKLFEEIVKDDSTGVIINACLGLSGEVGEFNDMIKKWIFHESELDELHAKKELGDILWYVALMCEAFGWDFDEIFTRNILKLKKRYPDGFDKERSEHRAEGDV